MLGRRRLPNIRIRQGWRLRSLQLFGVLRPNQRTDDALFNETASDVNKTGVIKETNDDSFTRRGQPGNSDLPLTASSRGAKA
jgi:hypothetical protein